MSIRGQGTKSIRKKLLNNSVTPVVGTKSIVFFHKATNKQQYIDVTSLVAPTGHVNPSPNELTKARLKDFENNFELVSSVKGTLMKPLSYEVVTNTTIRLKFEALEGEIFEGRLHNYVTNGTLIADVRTPNASGELLSGQTDFNLGEAIPITDLSSQWPIQLFRGNSGNPMLRNVGNADYLGDNTIGNYKMVDRGDGFCQVIRFNIAGDVNNETIMWASHGALGERPNLSVLQSVDKIHGIMDLMRQDLLDVTGNNVIDPTRYDNGVPTNSDLKAFGDKVALYDIKERLSILLKPKIIEVYSAVSNVLKTNTVSSIASLSGTGASPVLSVTRRCKATIFMSASFQGNTNGMSYVTLVNGVVVAVTGFGANPNFGISGAGGGYVGILEVQDSVTFDWTTTDATSRYMSILLEEI